LKREARKDRRASLEERYPSLQAYLERARQAAGDLVREGFLLANDVEGVLEDAAARWEAFHKA
jgi:hypothetical protein